MTDQERIATLLTGLDLTIEIAETILTTSYEDIETLKKAVGDLAAMKKYAEFARQQYIDTKAASERSRLSEREEDKG